MTVLRCLFILPALFGALPAAATSLADLRWQARPVLVFAPTPADERFRRQWQLLRQARPDLSERDVLIIGVIGDAVRPADPAVAIRASAAELRSQLRVADDEFAILLIGKDGGVKLRADAPLEICRLFERIDAMPMRRAEMRQRKQGPNGCSTSP